MRAFISSEMGSPADTSRRLTAKRTVRELGHQPIGFEDLPARPFPVGVDAIEACRRLVRGCHVLLAIIDDEVTEAVEAEIEEARTSLGAGRTFFYFTNSRRRDPSSAALWAQERKGSKLAVFDNDDELAESIRVSIASFIDDALVQRPPGGVQVKLAPGTLSADELKWWSFRAVRGNRIAATCTANGPFYATLVNAAGFARLHNNRRGRGLATDSDKSAHHFEMEVESSGDFYLMIRGSFWLTGTLTVTPRVFIE